MDRHVDRAMQGLLLNVGNGRAAARRGSKTLVLIVVVTVRTSVPNWCMALERGSRRLTESLLHAVALTTRLINLYTLLGLCQASLQAKAQGSSLPHDNLCEAVLSTLPQYGIASHRHRADEAEA